jgi:hypothetical protein
MAPKGEESQQHGTAQQAGVSLDAIKVMLSGCLWSRLPVGHAAAAASCKTRYRSAVSSKLALHRAAPGHEA